MPDDASPAAAGASSGHRKRKAVEHPGGGEKAPNSVRRRPSESLADEHVAILRAAIEFRDRTGLAPTKNMAAFYDSVKSSLATPLSQDNVYNRLRHLRYKFNHPSDHDDDLVLKLAAELWSEEQVKKGNKEDKAPKNDKKLNLMSLEADRSEEKARKEGKSPKKEKKHNLVSLEEYKIGEKKKKEGMSLKKEKTNNSVALEADRDAEKEEDEKDKKRVDMKLNKKQNLAANEEEEKEEEMKDKNGEERAIVSESFPYLTHAVAEHWKVHGLAKASFDMGMKLINPKKAKALEDKWKRLLEDEMRFQREWAKTCREILAMLLETHKVSDVPLVTSWSKG